MSVDDSTSGLFVDLYELTMAQAYLQEGRHEEAAVFDLFFRTLPPQRNFLIAAGLSRLVEELEQLRFSAADVAYLESLGRFAPDFLEWLGDWRFRGTVRAIPEGSVCFADEPLIEVSAPLADAQLIETLAINRMHFATLIASKGARVIAAADGRSVVDFGARRAHGVDAAVEAARALHLAGFDATSNVEAGRRYGIPVAGTMAHSYVQSHANDLAAFRAFVAAFPDTILLVDTYDTGDGVEAVIALAGEFAERGESLPVRALRIDSGDLAEAARDARARLDAAGLESVELLASGGLDEDDVAALVDDGAPYDGFGVGTRVISSADAPTGDAVYKLVALGGRGLIKLSTAKETLPGAKQVFRQFDADGRATGDVLTVAEDTSVGGEPLLVEVMRDGAVLDEARVAVALDAARSRAAVSVGQLADELRSLEPAAAYPVVISDALRDEHDRVVARSRD